MTTTPTPARADRVDGADRAARRRALERRSTGQAFWSALLMVWTVGLWFWGIFVLVQVGVSVLLARLLGEGVDGVSISIGPVGTPQVFLFVMGIVTGAGLLTLHVAAGATRRTAALGWLLAAPVVGISFGAVGVAVTALLRWLDGLGWAWLDDGPASTPFADALPTLGATSILGTLTLLTGIAVNVLYRRLGGWWGTLALPLAVAPALGGHALLLRGQESSTPSAGVDVASGAWLLSLALVVLVAAGVHLLLRRIPID